MTADSVIALDLATLDVLTRNAVENDNVVFVKVLNGDGSTLSEASDPNPVDRKYQLNLTAPITVGSKEYGRINIGLNTKATALAVNDALRWMASIAGIEILLVGVFGYLLGNVLVAQLKSLREGVIRVSEDDFGYQVSVLGKDEFSETASRFNDMSRALSTCRTQADMAFEHAMVGILMVGRNREIHGANPEAQRIFRDSSSQIQGL
jgi:methyl-accepting chemotaxis protein